MNRLNWYCFCEEFINSEMKPKVRMEYCKIRDAIRGSHGYPKMVFLDKRALNELFKIMSPYLEDKDV